ncbi:MAG: acetyl-CoA carboxylase biotin carboxyl carrier protein [Croceibacterium sp.]
MAETGKTGRAPRMNIDTALVRELAELLSETGLTEIEVEDGDRKIKVSRGMVAPAQALSVAAAPAAAAAPAEQPAAPVDDTANAIRSPMVGTAYLHPEPGADSFVSVGDKVKAGQTLLIIEAMKVMNPIAATADGVVQKILITNAQPVEFDQPLVVVV